jgi:hypothetical protein
MADVDSFARRAGQAGFGCTAKVENVTSSCLLVERGAGSGRIICTVQDVPVELLASRIS